ncbi:hypothetical protein [Streptomyces sp. MMBL 11-3]|uniref:hypothetical protein n=1 Tax=Streptomyces sp. MMBL 11-3 TaxID=3382639 RepID=UPI0039B39A5C
MVTKVARELGISSESLRGWVEEAHGAGRPARGCRWPPAAGWTRPRGPRPVPTPQGASRPSCGAVLRALLRGTGRQKPPVTTSRPLHSHRFTFPQVKP